MRVAGVSPISVLGVIVTYFPDMEMLVRLVGRLCPQLDALLVVDNSDPGDDRVSGLLVSAEFQSGKLRIARAGRNIGVAAAINIGLDAALSERHTHVLLSDQDSLPDSVMVKGLLRAVDEVSERGIAVGAVGPAYEDQQTGLVYPFQVQEPGKLFYSRLRISEQQPNLLVLSLITSGTLIPVSVLRTVGAMREDLFIDGVDWEWCHRAVSKGYALVGSGYGRMQHNMGDGQFRVWFFTWRNMSVYDPVRVYYGIRNFTYLLRLGYVPLRWKIRVGIYWLGNIYGHLFFSSSRLKCAVMIGRGLHDAMRGRLGKIDNTGSVA